MTPLALFPTNRTGKFAFPENYPVDLLGKLAESITPDEAISSAPPPASHVSVMEKPSRLFECLSELCAKTVDKRPFGANRAVARPFLRDFALVLHIVHERLREVLLRGLHRVVGDKMVR